MPVDALGLALAAAVVHAAWNAGLAGAEQTRAATAAALLSGALLCAPLAVAAWDVDADAVPFVVASAAAELAYVTLLAAAYARAEMSVVYPVARGVAPVLVLVGAVVALSARPSGLQVAGVLLVCAGVLAVRGARTGRGVGLALAVAAFIATYTVIDKRGLEHAAALSYLELVVGGSGVAFALLLLARGEGGALRAALGVRALATGAGMFAAYGLTLAALRLASAPAVAAVRETSVVFGVGLAALFLGERVTALRVAGAVAVAGGIALIAA